jgi:hypothetical protein
MLQFFFFVSQGCYNLICLKNLQVGYLNNNKATYNLYNIWCPGQQYWVYNNLKL